MSVDTPATVFICHAPEDEPFRRELEKHLTVLRRQGYITSWSSHRIGAGADARAEIEQHMREARVILLLVSADLLASDEIYDVELPLALARDAEPEPARALVYTVPVRPADYAHDRLAKLRTLLPDGGSVSSAPNRDEAWKAVASRLREQLRKHGLGGRMSLNPMGEPRLSIEKAPELALAPTWNVPYARNPRFTGRIDELDRLRQNFARRIPRTPVQAICGLGGVGKTALALEYAYRFASEYKVVWWLRAEEPATLAASFADLGVALRLPGRAEPGVRAAFEAVKQWLAKHDRWLLVFDSAREPEDVAPYLPTSIPGHVLVTSRRASWGALSLPLQLRPMKRSEAVELLLTRSGRGGSDAPARALAEALGDLPLALAQAGAYIEETGVSIAEYTKRFQERRAELMRRGAESDSAPTVATTWELAFRDLQERSQAAVELLNLCAFLSPDEIPRDELARGAAELPPALAAACADPFALDEALSALRRYSLIDVPDDATAASFSVHRLVQAAARDRLSEEERRAWAGRAVAFACAVFPEEADDVAERGACRTWLPHARAALGNARAAKVAPGEPAERLLRHAAVYQHHCGFEESAREMLEQALAIAEAIHGPTDHHVAMALCNLGPVLMNLRDLAGAERAARRALAIDERNHGETSAFVATDAINLAAVLKEIGELDEAEKLVRRALAIDEALGPAQEPAVARDANNLGAILREKDDLLGARRCFERAIAIDERRGAEDLPLHLNNLGLLLREMGELDEAQRLAERALAIGKETYEDDPNVATFHSNLASLLVERRMLAEARPHLERALEIGERIYGSDHYAIAIRRNNLGLLLRDLGDLHAAREELEKAVAIARRVLGADHRRVKKLEQNLAFVLREISGPGSIIR
jgi:tetratricopeptide (TPR) repeat protein